MRSREFLGWVMVAIIIGVTIAIGATLGHLLVRAVFT